MRLGLSWGERPVVRAFQLFQVMRQSAALLGAVLVTKSAMPIEAIGTYEQYLYVQYALTFFWLTGLVQGLLSWVSRGDVGKQTASLRGAWLCLLGLSLLAALALALGKAPLLDALIGQADLPWTGVFLLAMVLNTSAFLVEYVLLLREKAQALVGYGLFVFVGSLLAIWVPLSLGLGVSGIFSGLALLGVAKQSYLLWLLWGRRESRPVEWADLRSWVLLSFPLVLYTFVGGLIPSVNAWILGHVCAGDPGVFALFRYGTREIPLTVALSEALNAAFIPILSKDFTAGLAYVRKRTEQFLHLVFPLSCVLVLGSGWWFPRLFNPDFAESARLFNLFSLVLVSRAFFSKALLIALNDNRWVLLFSVGELLLQAILGLLLVPRWGLAGLVWANVGAYVFEKAAQVWRLYFTHGVAPGRFVPFSWLIGYTLALIACVYGSGLLSGPG
jgi:O-antigen/teichoic acid export membrane protein